MYKDFLMQLYTENNTKYTFFPHKVDFNTVKNIKSIFNNDVFEKHLSEATVQGELVICNDVSKLEKGEKRMIKETFNDYKENLKTRDDSKDKWIYNIIDGISEKDKILYDDELCVIIPNYVWNEEDDKKMQIMAICKNKELKTLRSLTSEHIPLLEHMKSCALITIKNKYNVGEDSLKIFIHYEPSAYLLHIHFVNINNVNAPSSIEYSHDLDSVIYNLNLDSDYYKKIILNKRISIINL